MYIYISYTYICESIYTWTAHMWWCRGACQLKWYRLCSSDRTFKCPGCHKPCWAAAPCRSAWGTAVQGCSSAPRTPPLSWLACTQIVSVCVSIQHTHWHCKVLIFWSYFEYISSSNISCIYYKVLIFWSYFEYIKYIVYIEYKIYRIYSKPANISARLCPCLG